MVKDLTDEQYWLTRKIVNSCNFITCFVWFVIYIISFYCKKCGKSDQSNQKKSINKIAIIISMLYVITYLVRYLLYFIDFIVTLKDVQNIPEIIFQINDYILDILLILGNGWFFALMIFRLYQSFRKSILAFKIYSMLLFCLILVAIVVVNSLYFFNGKSAIMYFILVGLNLILGMYD